MVASGGWGGKENKCHPRHKRLLMDALNNQPNSLSVCGVGRFSIKSRLNIGSRVGTWVQEGAVISPVLFLPGVTRTRHRPRTGGHPELSGNRSVFCLTRGSFANFTLLPLFDGDCLFWAAVLEYLYSVSTQATV